MRQKLLVALVLGFAAVGAVVLLIVGRKGPFAGPATLPDAPKLAALPAGGASAPPSLLSPESPEDVAKQVAATLEAWRRAVVNRDADTVVKLDLAFVGTPARYLEALKRSALSDGEERVRAFSTRVLGKLKQSGLAETFERLLEDESPYVRQNAAWALGELGADAEGRAAAQHAVAGLRRLTKRDPAGDVRSAARGALASLE